MLARRVLVLGVLDGYAHVLQGEHGALTQVSGQVRHRQLEVRAGVERLGRLTRFARCKVEVLDLGGGVKREPAAAGTLERPPEHVPGTAFEWRAVEVGDVAEHAGYR